MKNKTTLTTFAAIALLAIMPILTLSQNNNSTPDAAACFSPFSMPQNLDGSLDASFGGDGIVTTNFGDFGYGGARGLAIQPDGNIVAAGSWGLDGEFAYFAVARYIGDSVACTPFTTVTPIASAYLP